VEHHDRLPAGGVPGDLDGVFHRLRTGVEQHAAFRPAPRCHRGQRLTHPQVVLVTSHHETRVGERVGLCVTGAGDPGCSITDTGDRDAGAEVDHTVAVDIGEYPAVGSSDIDGQGACHTCGHSVGAALLQPPGLRSGDLGGEPAGLGQFGGGTWDVV